MLKVVVEGAGTENLTYDLKKAVIAVGASSSNDLVIRAPGVAPTHLVFQRSGDVVTFLGQSRQVVTLNGERRARGVVRAGDKVRIGTVTLIVEEVETATVINETAVPRGAAPTRPAGGGAEAPPQRTRSEVVLYNEPDRLASARDFMSRSLCDGRAAQARDALSGFFESFFPGQKAMLATLDSDGCFESVFSTWAGEPPRLPRRTFEELSREGRFAHLRIGSTVYLIFPVERHLTRKPFYLVVETAEHDCQEDELLLGELARMILVKWPNLETSDLVAGEWRETTRRRIEAELPGTSGTINALREATVSAAGSHFPVLVTGVRGSGRTWLARFIASVCPAGPRDVRIVEVRKDGDAGFRLEFYGSNERRPMAEIVERFGRGSVVVIRNLHWLSAEIQDELAEVINEDLRSLYGPSMRWIATSERKAAEAGMVADNSLLQLFGYHALQIPTFDERREDLPLVVVGVIKGLAKKLDKEIAGIDLSTLNSLMTHSYEHQMSDLVRDLTRLVVATPSGEIIHGVASTVCPPEIEPSDGGEGESMVDLLVLDDLKTVIPAVEKVIIDRVLRRTMGNQSKAARDLNLSRGALIAKMKDYAIPDYRYLRRQK